MSFNAEAGGILETHVTWEEFESNLTTELCTKASLGPRKRAIDIADGIGLASRCALIDCDWQGDNEHTLPKRILLKIASCLPILKLMGNVPEEVGSAMEKNIKDMHNIECESYNWMERFGEGHAFPKIYYARQFNEQNPLAGQICMEYVENGRMMYFHENATLRQMRQIARAIGKLQADSIKHNVISELLTTADIVGKMATVLTREQYLHTFEPLKMMEPSLIESIEPVEALLADYYGSTLSSTIHKQLGLAPVLVNGDLRTENVLVDRDSGDLRALIDWQCSHLGTGVEDLLRISFFAQSSEDRRSSARLLIEEMHTAFADRLGEIPAPITLKQLEEVYDLLFPHCALYFANGLALFIGPNKPRAGHDGEMLDRYAVVLDKARGIFDDIITFHQENLDSKHKVDWKYADA